jgi:hypothetical protein
MSGQSPGSYQEYVDRNIAQNRAKLEELFGTSTPAKSNRAPRAPARLATSPSRPASTHTVGRAQWTLRTRAGFTVPAATSSDDSASGDPHEPRAKLPRRHAAVASEFELVGEDARALVAEHVGADWLDKMDKFLKDESLHVEFCPRARGACSDTNAKSVLASLRQLASGEGLTHRNSPSFVFMRGEALTLAHDADELFERACEWLETAGPDSGRGWLVTHPISKFAGFQRYAHSTLPPAPHLVGASAEA